jgi:hypothetical protein
VIGFCSVNYPKSQRFYKGRSVVAIQIRNAFGDSFRIAPTTGKTYSLNQQPIGGDPDPAVAVVALGMDCACSEIQTGVFVTAN